VDHHARVTFEAHVLAIFPFDRSFGFGFYELSVAMSLAEENIAKRNFTNKIKFYFRFADSECNEKDAAMAFITHYFAQQVSVVIGPFCDYSLSSVGSYAPYWNIPVVSPGGFSHEYDKRGEDFNTLTRVGGTLETMSGLLFTFMHRSNWTKFVIIYEP
ncbi:unnamed protein product, partial [Lymnaea stagnalis]